MTREEMVEEIIALRRERCLLWLSKMQKLNPYADAKGLVDRWFRENPLHCDQKHDAGLIEGGLCDAK